MIARIIPIKRLPKQLSVLDYTVPEKLKKDIQIGQLVSIQIRQSQVFGIVLSIKNLGDYTGKIKELDAIVHTTPLLSKRQLHVYRIVSRWYGVSLSALLKISLLPQQKRKLSTKHLFFPLKNQVYSFTPVNEFYSYTDSKQLFHLIKNSFESLDPNGQLLILCPLQNRAEEIRESLKLFGLKAVLWTGSLRIKEQFEQWVNIRNGEAKIIIASRSGVLLPFFSLQHIIIDQSTHDGHKQFEQSPLIDSRDIAHLLSQIFGTKITNTIPTLSMSAPKPIIVDMRGEQANAEYSLISQRIRESLQNLNGDACFWLNRRGYASSFSCQLCGFISSCHRCGLPLVYHKKTNQLRCHHCYTQGKILTHCPNCSQDMLKLRGAGSELLGEELKQLKKELLLPHKIIGIDSDVDESELLQHRDNSCPVIIYGTQKALPFVDMDKNRLFVILKANAQLAVAEYTAEQNYYQKIQWIRFFQHKQAKLYLQSINPEHPFFSYLSDHEQFNSHLLKQRKALNYPPYTYLTRYLIKTSSEHSSKSTAENMYASLQKLLTQEKKSLTISRPYALQPVYYRGGYWYAILVRFDAKNWENELLWLNRYIPMNWKIDPNPTNIFSF